MDRFLGHVSHDVDRPANHPATREPTLESRAGLDARGGAAAAGAVRTARPDLFRPEQNAKRDDDSCLLLGAGDYKEPRVYAVSAWPRGMIHAPRRRGDVLQVFLRSLRESGCRCDVTLFVDDASSEAVRAVFRRFGAKWHRFLPAVDGLTDDEVSR